MIDGKYHCDLSKNEELYSKLCENIEIVNPSDTKTIFVNDEEKVYTCEELSEILLGKLEHLQPANEQEAYLVKLLSTYEPDADIYDEQMKELFRWGADEKDLWQVQTSYEGT